MKTLQELLRNCMIKGDCENCDPGIKEMNFPACLKRLALMLQHAVETADELTEDLTRRGKWLPPVVGKYGCLCSVCRKQADNDYDFCPNCGKKMERRVVDCGEKPSKGT